MDIIAIKNELQAAVSGAAIPATKPEGVIDYASLVTNNMRLVYDRIKLVHGVTDQNREDVQQAGMLALCKAAKNFDPDKGFCFSTFVVTSIDNAMHREVQSFYRRQENTVSYQAVLEMEDQLTGEGLIASDPRTASPEYLYEQKLAETALTNLIPLYPPDHKPALVAMQMRTEGYKKHEIVDALGIPSNNYRNQIHRTSKKIKRDAAFRVYVAGIGHKSKTSA